ncbi:MAG: tetratricopeptide repeat protein, partial [Verrucomicrobiae bacterium]|nr:tetratricopeptide repeat protein [Verrucomicrobiae bacterium]
MRKALLFAALLLAATARAGSAAALPPTATGPEAGQRPAWLIGMWFSDPHRVTLDADGSCSFLFYAPLSGDPDKFRLGATGSDTWSWETQEPNGIAGFLNRVGQGYSVRPGLPDGLIYFMNPVTHCEVPFYRVGATSAETIKNALAQIKEAERDLSLGNHESAEKALAEALSQLRQMQDRCPVITARAAFGLARALERGGKPDDAVLFYNHCLRLRESAFETPHHDLMAAYLAAGQCVNQASGYGPASWYLVRAALVQRQVLLRIETAGDTPELVRRAACNETAAVYIECAAAFSKSGHTPTVVGLLPAAHRLAITGGNRQYARVAATLLFNYLMARPTDHDYSELLLSTQYYLEQADAGEPLIRRADLSGMIHQAVRLAQEMPAMDPPRPDLARRFALRAVALQRLGSVTDPPYIQRQLLPEIVAATGISNEVANLRIPPSYNWPPDQATAKRTEFIETLDSVVSPVDLRSEFPDLKLDPGALAPDRGELANAHRELETMLPMLLSSARRPTAAQEEADIRRYLEAAGFPPRSPERLPEPIDLSAYYNARLGQDWHNPADAGNNLSRLPAGLQELGGMRWEVRGIVQLDSPEIAKTAPGYPKEVTGIMVGQKCRRLHFLQGAGWLGEDGTVVARYHVRYADGTTTEIPVVYGRDLRNWQFWPEMPEPEKTGGMEAWRGPQERWE